MAPASAKAAGASAQDVSAVSMGDAYISGEGGRWQGNAAGDWSKGGVDPAVKDATDRVKTAGLSLDQIYAPREALSDGRTPGCHRSDVSEINGAMGTPTSAGPVNHVMNFACSGAASLTTAFKEQRPQLDQLNNLLDNHRTRVMLIALSIGGDFLPVTIEKCVNSWRATKWCSTDPEVTGSVDTALKSVGSKVTAAIEQIKASLKAADSPARIILQSYPNPLARGNPATTVGNENSWDRWSAFGCPFYNKDLQWLSADVIASLAAELKKVAQAEGITFLDLTDILQGHEVCSSQAQQAEKTPRGQAYVPPAADTEWARYFERSTSPLPASQTQEPMHPNYWGQKAMANCLFSVAKQLNQVDHSLSLRCDGAAGRAPEKITAAPAP